MAKWFGRSLYVGEGQSTNNERLIALSMQHHRPFDPQSCSATSWTVFRYFYCFEHYTESHFHGGFKNLLVVFFFVQFSLVRFVWFVVFRLYFIGYCLSCIVMHLHALCVYVWMCVFVCVNNFVPHSSGYNGFIFKIYRFYIERADSQTD